MNRKRMERYEGEHEQQLPLTPASSSTSLVAAAAAAAAPCRMKRRAAGQGASSGGDDDNDNNGNIKTLKLMALQKLHEQQLLLTQTERHAFFTLLKQGDFSASFAHLVTFIVAPNTDWQQRKKMWCMWGRIMIMVDPGNVNGYQMINTNFESSLASKLLQEVGILSSDYEERPAPTSAQDMLPHYQSFYASVARAIGMLLKRAVFQGRYEQQLVLHRMDFLAREVHNRTISVAAVANNSIFQKDVHRMYADCLSQHRDGIHKELEDFVDSTLEM